MVRVSHNIDDFEEEGKSNALLLQYLSSLLNLPLFNLSMSHEKNRLAVRVSEMDYEDFYMRLKNFLSHPCCNKQRHFLKLRKWGRSSSG